MSNPGQPTIRQGATGDSVRRLQRAIFRTADHEIHIDGIFGWQTEEAVLDFQKSEALTPDGVVGPLQHAPIPSRFSQIIALGPAQLGPKARPDAGLHALISAMSGRICRTSTVP
jgi:peptidoglycan hydrolase-like protein with peptidoglycan-binding domain